MPNRTHLLENKLNELCFTFIFILLSDDEYVLVEIPIPAGCSYHEKRSFTVSLLPRYNGVYSLNPAKVEMMYFPVFYGREAMRKVRIDAGAGK